MRYSKIAILVTAVLSSSAAVAKSTDNTADIDQFGNHNTAEIIQQGDSVWNNAEIVQNSIATSAENKNTAKITQELTGAANNGAFAKITQTAAEGSEADITQENNVGTSRAIIDSTGANNDADIIQKNNFKVNATANITQAMGENEAYIEQRNADNAQSNIYQNGTGDKADIVNVGSDYSDATVTQDGNGLDQNTAKIEQTRADHAWADVTQTGDGNYALVVQDTKNYNASAGPDARYTNTVDIAQDGDNDASVYQYATNNNVDLEQFGTSTATITQNDTGNSVDSKQFAGSNVLTVTQSGNAGDVVTEQTQNAGTANSITISQHAASNGTFAKVIQTDGGNTATIDQYGSEQWAELTQSMGNTADVEQSGQNQTANLMQSGSGDTVFITQKVGGASEADGNFVKVIQLESSVENTIDITQDGMGNKAGAATENGIGSSITIVQDGNNNEITGKGQLGDDTYGHNIYGEGIGASTNGGNNSVDIYQDGNSNRVFAHASVNNSIIEIDQTGNGHFAQVNNFNGNGGESDMVNVDIKQYDVDQNAYVNFHGDRADIDIEQWGGNNTADVEFWGNDIQVDINQSGYLNTAVVDMDMESHATWNQVTINQGDTNNTANVYMSGSHNTATITQGVFGPSS
ncbi:hypothetical protein L2750_19435 [Shewanella submarina]|uniref:Curlin n=1 Tax=Shewanella submarina TaxID=2016376 RepID=A0ABV7G660_9GAMM|nr:hypothetical protein [Shewanella submarina]MCL1039298.1 hypothetical protein [Shewanella submarina]